MALSVSELAERTGTSPDTVRYYSRLGLLPEAGRTDAGHRFYDDAAVERLRFIKGAQWLDLRLEEIGELLEALDGEGCPCGFSEALIRRRVAEIDQERARLDEKRALLCRLLDDRSPVPAAGTKPGSQSLCPPAGAAPDTGKGPVDGRAVGEGDCGCCRPDGPVSTEEQIRELEARRAAVERRLRRLLVDKER